MHKGLKRTVAAALIGLGLYSLLGFLILPGAALRVINQQLANYSTVPAKLERLQLNPFTLELTLWGLHLGAATAEQVALAKLQADLQWDSLWSAALHLADVRLEQPKVELLFAKDGTLNLSQLFKLPASSPASDAEAASKPFPLHIERITLAGGKLHFQDLRPSKPIDVVYDALDFELNNLSTLPGTNAEMALVASGPNGGRLEWHGQIALSPISSSGNLRLSDGQLTAIWPYVRDAVPLALQDGVVNLYTDYRLDLADTTQLQLSNLELKLAPLAISNFAGQPLLKLASLSISETSVDLAKQQVLIGKIRSQGLEAWAAREADGQLDWQKLLASQPTAPSANASPATSSTAASKPWQIRLRDMQLRDYQIHLTDRAVQPAVALELGPLNLDLNDFDSLNPAPFTLSLDTGVGKRGKLKAAGQVALNPVSATLKVDTQNIDLRMAQAYVDSYVRLELRSGMLDSALAIDLKSSEPLAFNIDGNVQIKQLHTRDTVTAKHRDFIKWQQLALEGLSYQHGDSLSINKIQFEQPYVRFIINETRNSNVAELLIAQPAASPSPSPSPESASAAAKSKPLRIVLGEITISNGSANFADLSLQPGFATAIALLEGHIGRIDSSQLKPASVSIKGKVDRYAPVSIIGSVNPFNPLTSLDMAVSFKQVELTTLTPYSGKFAGYRILKGRLDLDLLYKINQGQLNAENKLVLEQLELGEQVDSPDAVDLPVRLAIALLKDSDGKIEIALPVSGDLNNPQFEVMPIVWQTLRNLVLRAAQAPFKFIAGLVSGAEDVNLDRVQFSAGSADLDPQAQSVLNTLARALKQRPNLRLEVQGISAQAADGPLLAEQRLQREYQSSYYKMLQSNGDTVPAEASLLEVPVDEKADLLEGIYRAQLKQNPPSEWSKLDDQQRTDKMRAQLTNNWASNQLLLRKLGQTRAANIKHYLVDTGGLADKRIYLLDVDIAQAETGGRIASALQLGSQ
jgi:outer membrane protein OmpA-like peptidoglycan-associated protein